MKKEGLVISLITAMSSALAINGKSYQGLQPNFVLEDFFNGKIKAWGIIQSRSGEVLSKFDVDMVGTWSGESGKLVEKFKYYDSGKIQDRVWEITKLDDKHYIGKAGDIIGQATGVSYGNAINWSYSMYVPVKGSSIKFKFDDWMWAMNGNTVMNRSYLKKFGITFAELTIFMQKQDG